MRPADLAELTDEQLHVYRLELVHDEVTVRSALNDGRGDQRAARRLHHELAGLIAAAKHEAHHRQRRDGRGPVIEAANLWARTMNRIRDHETGCVDDPCDVCDELDRLLVDRENRLVVAVNTADERRRRDRSADHPTVTS